MQCSQKWSGISCFRQKLYIYFSHLETKQTRGLLFAGISIEVYRREVYNASKLNEFVFFIIRNKETNSK